MFPDNSSFQLNAPAKINWFLIVRGLRNDGFHEIISLMQRVSIYDEILFEMSKEIEIITDADIPIEDNLIYKTINLLKASFRDQTRSKGVRITLKKEIPIAAGLGGGSSDAATTLIGLNRLWRLGLSTKEMMKVGALIGSDVPFFLSSPVAKVRGRGDIVYPVKLSYSYPLLLVKPPVKVETKWAYSEFDRRTKVREKNNSDYTSLFIKLLNEKELANLETYARNDLEDTVVKRFPEIGRIKRILKEQGAIFSIMSGSGPTVIGLFDSSERAKGALKAIPDQNWCKLVETIV